MERIINSNKDKQTIYEIYRACRLCGAGAGYKMPIIQSVVDLDGNGVELKQKILECLQIEVHQEDKMPPLVCELCVDKVNDFYEFLDLCRQTNKRTRQRLGLPLQAVTRGAGSDSGDCILGVTEPVYIPDEDDEPLTRNKSSKLKNTKNPTIRNVNVKIKLDPDAISKIKKEPELRVKLEKKSQESLMAEVSNKAPSTRHGKRAPSPSPSRGRSTRNSGNDDNISLSTIKKHGKRALSPSPPRGRSTRNSGNDDLVSLSSIKQQVKSEKSSAGSKSSLARRPSISSKDSTASKPGPASKSTSSKPGPASKSGPASKPGPASKTNSTSKPGPASKSESNKSGPASKSESNKSGPTSKPESNKPGPASKSGPTSKPGPASKSDSSSKSGSSKPGPASKSVSIHKPGPASKSVSTSKPGPILRTGSTSKSPPSLKSPVTKSSPPLRSILKRDVKKEEDSSPTVRGKRLRDKDPEKEEVPLKKLRISIEKSAVMKPKLKRPPTPPPTPVYTCGVCKAQYKTPQAHSNHMRIHVPNFTNSKLACNACGEWFSNIDETAAHHRQHRIKHKPYHCRRCDNDFKQLQAYDSHFDSDCLPDEEVEDNKCYDCWLTFPTENLLDDHKCLGEDGRPGGKCYKCERPYSLLKNLKKHESTCTAKKKLGSGEVIIDPAVQAQLLPYYVRMARCDSLLTGGKRRVYDVSDIPSDFGLDRNCIYPYRFYRSWFKSDFTVFDSMVSIKDDVKNEFCNRDFVHWDSDESAESDSDVIDSGKKVQIESLAALTLKIIFSQGYVGKVPRKRRKEKVEKGFDNADFDIDINKDINNIIRNLNNETHDEDSMVSDSIMDNFNNTDDLTDNSHAKDHRQKDSGKPEGNAMEVDVNAVINDDHKDSDGLSVDEQMDTSEIENSSKDTIENKESNSTDQIVLSETVSKSQINDTKVNGDAKQISNEEINDKRLMEEIDAQIGEDNDTNLKNDYESNENNDRSVEEKTTNIIQKENNIKCMDMDNISEEEVNLEV